MNLFPRFGVKKMMCKYCTFEIPVGNMTKETREIVMFWHERGHEFEIGKQEAIRQEASRTREFEMVKSRKIAEITREFEEQQLRKEYRDRLGEIKPV